MAQIAHAVIEQMGCRPRQLPTAAYLAKPEVRAAIVAAVEERYRLAQTELTGVLQSLDIAAVVAKTAEFVAQGTISIPRISVVPTGQVTSRFEPFELDLRPLRYPGVDDELWIQHLRTGRRETVALQDGRAEEARPEDYVVRSLVDFDDVSYDDHADLLYELATQTVHHFRTYLAEDQVRKVLLYHQREIARFIHAQMQAHYCEEAAGYEVVVSRGFTPLKSSAYTAPVGQPVLDYRVAPLDKSNMAAYLFGGFSRCLYPTQKFQSDSERKLAVLLEREALKMVQARQGPVPDLLA